MSRLTAWIDRCDDGIDVIPKEHIKIFFGGGRSGFLRVQNQYGERDKFRLASNLI